MPLSLNYYAALSQNEQRPTPPRILERINVTLRAPLISLSVSDHYVEVSTSKVKEKKRKELVLIRLSDAIAETGDIIGLRIHRSHWVVVDQIVSVAKKDSKAMLTTKNSAIFPISRTYMAQAKDLGIV